MITLQQTATIQNIAYRHILVGEDRQEVFVSTVFDEVILAVLQDAHATIH